MRINFWPWNYWRTFRIADRKSLAPVRSNLKAARGRLTSYRDRKILSEPTREKGVPAPIRNEIRLTFRSTVLMLFISGTNHPRLRLRTRDSKFYSGVAQIFPGDRQYQSSRLSLKRLKKVKTLIFFSSIFIIMILFYFSSIKRWKDFF